MNDNSNERQGGGPGGGQGQERGGPGGGRGGGGRGRGEKGARRGGFRRRRVCKFCVEHIDHISYKDVRMLQGFIPERGKIQPRRISGTCALHQRKLQTAIKRARQLALIPYLTD
jgi:small subunit ribosomal protein S18